MQLKIDSLTVDVVGCHISSWELNRRLLQVKIIVARLSPNNELKLQLQFLLDIIEQQDIEYGLECDDLENLRKQISGLQKEFSVEEGETDEEDIQNIKGFLRSYAFTSKGNEKHKEDTETLMELVNVK